jgi:hypothetical protein
VNFSLHHRVQYGSGAHPSLYPMSTGGGGLSLEVKQPGREANNSPPSSAEVKERVELYIHSSNAYSRRGARLKKIVQGQLYLSSIWFIPSWRTYSTISLTYKNAAVLFYKEWMTVRYANSMDDHVSYNILRDMTVLRHQSNRMTVTKPQFTHDDDLINKSRNDPQTVIQYMYIRINWNIMYNKVLL